VFRFPRGIRPGHCLHAIFEHLDFPYAQGAVLTAGVHQALARHGIDPVWAGAARTLVQRTLDTQLTSHTEGGGLRLRNLSAADRLNELEFHFALDGAEPRALSRLVTAHGYADPGIGGAAALRGLMKGYIDLVFRWNGRYYLADYKSNHLGDRFEDYRREVLIAAMNAHRYPLQYLIYCVALHRWLRRRVPGYRYEEQFGGVYYLFLRGLRPDLGPASGVYYDRPGLELIEALDAALSPPLGQPA
jgi:exodeoxyribonuclease V beta subunit